MNDPASCLKLFIRIPTNRRPVADVLDWMVWASRTWPSADIRMHWCGKGTAVARNEILAEFRRGLWDTLWMIDDDVTPPLRPPKFDLLDKRGILAGWYHTFLPNIGVVPMVYQACLDDEQDVQQWQYWNRAEWPKEPFYAGAGAGCLLMSGAFARQLPPNPFKYVELADGVVKTEDLQFYEDFGLPLVDPAYRCGHWCMVDLREVAMTQSTDEPEG